MRSADNSRRPRAPRPARPLPALLALGLVCAAFAPAFAQSGRAPAPTPDPTPDPTATRQSSGSRPRQVNNNIRRALPPAFVVVTAPPDGSQEASPYVPPGYGQMDLEEIARGACLVALRNQAGVKRVVSDLEVARWEARETALGEDEAWVVWIELTWPQEITRDASSFKLRYLLFEPRTGKIVSSGYGRGVRQTWGRPLPRTDIREQLRNAGRDIADQVVSELTKAP